MPQLSEQMAAMEVGLAVLLQKAGCEVETRDYLLAKKIRTIPVLAWLAENETELNDRLVDPFLNGVVISPDRVQVYR